MQAALQVCAFVAHFLLWHAFSWLKVEPSLQPQSNGVHSPPLVHASPGAFGPVGPPSGLVELLLQDALVHRFLEQLQHKSPSTKWIHYAAKLLRCFNFV